MHISKDIIEQKEIIFLDYYIIVVEDYNQETDKEVFCLKETF